MGLFDDDFYSAKVSRRIRIGRAEADPFRGRSKIWSSAKIIMASSVAGAAIGAVLFATVFGWDWNSTSSQTALAQPQATSTQQPTVTSSAKVSPAVVSVLNRQLVPSSNASEDSKTGDDGALQDASVGSGVIFKDQDGKAFIITNHHVVAGANEVKVVLQSGESLTATVIGSDQITDLAVLSIDDKDIKAVANIGDSSALQSGEMVMAIGNPLGLGESISMGVISKTHQVIPVSLNQDGVYDWEQEVIQTDASINQGNSGGPLIDMDGNVIGINSMKISDLGVEGVGFALPINNVMPIVNELMTSGKVARPYLGVYTLDLANYLTQQLNGNQGGGAAANQGGTDSSSGSNDDQDSAAGTDSASVDGSDGGSSRLVLPDQVVSGVIVLEAVGPAKDAGLRYNDLIVKFDKQNIGSTMELRQYLYNKKKIGDTLEITFYRDGVKKTTTVELQEKQVDE